jgi:hypothetical protein
VAFAAIGGGVAAQNDPGAVLAVAGGLTYLFGAPVVHGAHGNRRRGVGSFAARLLVPIAGAGLASELEDDSSMEAQITAVAIGFGAGMLVTAAVDLAIPARDATAVVTPVPGGGAVIGLAGTF